MSAPSANRFGAVSPTTATAVSDEIGKFLNTGDFILDDGPCQIGIESTILDCTGPHPLILRPGFITSDLVKNKTGLRILKRKIKNKIKTSGLLDFHYSPKAEVILNTTAGIGDGFFAMSNIPTPAGSIRLGSPVTIDEYAKNLYSALRSADTKKLSRISLQMPEGEGLAEAIRDRLQKASGKKAEKHRV
jgi:L-threonylcarbamoyladenylate synthase